ncbi:hypothetical protein WJX74_000387 [Apatococcus lobatus]|uniref:Uncharacterized protein n=1 Tax=Apatococcus lobatus TaxID=904363 RepID=A0AAW1RBX4_9CHLO
MAGSPSSRPEAQLAPQILLTAAGAAGMPDRTAVTLVGADGRERTVGFEVTAESVQLFTEVGQSFEEFSFEAIIHWRPCRVKQGETGKADSFELRISTTKGPRNLRMRTSGPEEVHAILRQLEQNIAAVVERRRQADRQQSNMHEQPRIQASAEPSQQTFATGQSSHALRPLERGLSAASLSPNPSKQLQQQQQQHHQHHAVRCRMLGQQSCNMNDLAVPVREPSMSVEKLLSPARPGTAQQADVVGPASARRAPLLQQTPLIAEPQRASVSQNGTPKRIRFDRDNVIERAPSAKGVTAEQPMAARQGRPGDGMLGIPPGGTTPQRAVSGISRSRSMAAAQKGPQAVAAPSVSRSAGSVALPGARSSSPMALRLPRSASAITASPTAASNASPAFRPPSPQMLVQKRSGMPLGASAMMKEGELIAPPFRRHLDPRLLCMSSLPALSSNVPPQPASAVVMPSDPQLQTQMHFLEDMVRRLSAELAAPWPSDAGAGAVEDNEGQFHGPDVPLEWLSDPGRMCPLLAAYDGHLACAQRDARARERQLKRAQDRADAIAAENTQLKETAAAGANAAKVEPAVPTSPSRAEIDLAAANATTLQLQGRLQDTQASLARLQKSHQNELSRVANDSTQTSANQARLAAEHASMSACLASATADNAALHEQLATVTAKKDMLQQHLKGSNNGAEEQLALQGEVQRLRQRLFDHQQVAEARALADEDNLRLTGRIRTLEAQNRLLHETGQARLKEAERQALAADQVQGLEAEIRELRHAFQGQAGLEEQRPALATQLQARDAELQALRKSYQELDSVRADRDRKAAEAQSLQTTLLQLQTKMRGQASDSEEAAVLAGQLRMLEAEVRHLQQALQKRTAEAVQLSNEAASLAASGQEAERQAAQQSVTAQALQRELDDRDNSLQRMQKQLTEAKSCLEAERAAAGPSQAASQRLHNQMQDLQDALEAAQARAQEAAGSEAEGRARLSLLRHQHQEADAKALAATAEAASLRDALTASEKRLLEAQRRDAKVEEGVRKAMAAAAEAGIARDALLAREGALEAEVHALRQRQTALDTDLLAGSEARATMAGLQAALAAASNEAAGLRGQLAEVRASLERMAREKASAQAELAGLRERVECEGLSVRRSGAGLGSMRAAEAVREAEVGREQAEARERSAQMNAERARRQWDLARQQLEDSMAELRRRVGEKERTAEAAKAESSSLRRQVEAGGREVAAARQAHTALEQQLHSQLSAIRNASEAASHAMTARLESATEQSRRVEGEARRTADAKQALCERYQQEAAQNASVLSALKADHLRETAAQETALSSLKDEVSGLKRERRRMQKAVQGAEGEAAALRTALAQAQQRCTQAEAEAAGACSTAEGLAQARQELMGQVERACLEQRRAERKRDAALSQADALRLRSSSLSLLALPPTCMLDPEALPLGSFDGLEHKAKIRAHGHRRHHHARRGHKPQGGWGDGIQNFNHQASVTKPTICRSLLRECSAVLSQIDFRRPRGTARPGLCIFNHSPKKVTGYTTIEGSFCRTTRSKRCSSCSIEYHLDSGRSCCRVKSWVLPILYEASRVTITGQSSQVGAGVTLGESLGCHLSSISSPGRKLGTLQQQGEP